MSQASDVTAWLMRITGPLAGTRFPVGPSVTTIGRGAQNDVVISDSPLVSARHLEIRKDGSAYKVIDLGSRNGTFVNGERVEQSEVTHHCRIQLGPAGPELAFILGDTAESAFDRTIAAPLQSVLPDGAATQPARDRDVREQEDLLIQAASQSRAARHKGIGEQTLMIMRESLFKAVHKTRRKFITVIVGLVIALIGVSAFGAWKIWSLEKQRTTIHNDIRDIEARLQQLDPSQPEAAELYDSLRKYEDKAKSLEGGLLYRVAVHPPADPLEKEIKLLLAEFGAETYTVPAEFLEQTKRFVEQYQGPDRPNMTRGLGAARGQIDVMRAIFVEEHLPPDLAYMSIVESAMRVGSASSAGAVGLWQLTPATAKAYGLNITPVRDDRLDVQRSTHAACKYIRELIIDFGAGSSVMLALAAYNSGPSKVNQAIRRVTDPIRQRNFWYLYRVRALPVETREYVPKVIAVLVIGRHPEEFGF
jgi:hypothetical protein